MTSESSKEMTRIITYSLKAGAPNSDEYQRTISAFAETWLSSAAPKLHDLVNGFREYRQGRGELDRSDTEYDFELLALGVLLREHGREAGRMPEWAERVMGRLVDLQGRQSRLEKAIKGLRGWLGWVSHLVPGRQRNEDPLRQMIAWLEADVSGKLKIQGDMGLDMKLQQIL